MNPRSLHEAINIDNSSAWRQQRFAISNVFFGQRRSLLSNKKEEKRRPRISTHFHGRFHSVDSNAILSESRIIDFDLDPDNTYLVVVLLNINISAAELLLYPLPNTRHIHQFDKFALCSNKVLQTAKNTIWENIIYVIENTDTNDDTDEDKRWKRDGINVSHLYFNDNANGNASSNTSPKGGQLIMETGKQIISKIKTIKNVTTSSSDQNNVLSNKLNAFKSLWKRDNN
eukprot:996650_1